MESLRLSQSNFTASLSSIASFIAAATSVLLKPLTAASWPLTTASSFLTSSLKTFRSFRSSLELGVTSLSPSGETIACTSPGLASAIFSSGLPPLATNPSSCCTWLLISLRSSWSGLMVSARSCADTPALPPVPLHSPRPPAAEGSSMLSGAFSASLERACCRSSTSFLAAALSAAAALRAAEADPAVATGREAATRSLSSLSSSRSAA
mmetsp:Transcript_114444/g.208162  ORF Transcript_114444/g.208162 Transcript_114444/m.208162 type:complete len:209 (-) Transcript_114444:13-639(-)